MTEERYLRLCPDERASAQTAHSQYIRGTPMESPVPKKVSWSILFGPFFNSADKVR
jgi:hypothetical protein